MQSNELTPKQQAIELLKQAQSVLIVTGRQPSVDQVVSVAALQSVLAKLGKKSQAVITDDYPTAAGVIDTSRISRSLDGVRDFIISLDLNQVEVDKLKYDVADSRLNITITPHAGNFQASDARFDYGAYQFDLVVVLGVISIPKIDLLLEQNPTLFDGLHLINLDYHRINEQYGSVNYIDGSATSISEMLMSMFEALGQGMIDEEIGTALLTGIMATTNRFTTSSTTPKALTMAAQLMSGGARQQTVVKALYGGGVDSRDARPDIRPAATPRPAVIEEVAPVQPQKLADTLPPETVEQLQQASQAMQAEPIVEAQNQPVQPDETGKVGFMQTPPQPSRLQ